MGIDLKVVINYLFQKIFFVLFKPIRRAKSNEEKLGDSYVEYKSLEEMIRN